MIWPEMTNIKEADSTSMVYYRSICEISPSSNKNLVIYSDIPIYPTALWRLIPTKSRKAETL